MGYYVSCSLDKNNKKSTIECVYPIYKGDDELIKLHKENLKMLGLDQKWLRNQIQQQKADKIEEIILATVDKNRNLTIYHKTHELIGHTFID